MGWNIPKIWSGGRCFIIGGGPSMLSQFGIPKEVRDKVFKGELEPSAYSPYLSKLHDEHVIAVNMAFKLGDWVDMVFFGDSGFYKKNTKELMAFKGLRITCVGDIDPFGNKVKYVVKMSRKGFGLCTKPNKISWNQNSGAAAINIAYHLGVKTIYLLGFDMNVDEEKNQHWHKFYQTNPKTVMGTLKMHLRGFPQISQEAEAVGLEIINLNPNSNIRSFKMMNVSDIKF